MGISLQHLSELKRAEIARSLYKVTSEDKNKGEIHGLCPIHNESNPSFSYNYKKDVYNCLSCAADGDLLRLWSEVNGHGQKEGFKAFCTEFGIELGKKDYHAAQGTARNDNDTAVELTHEQIIEQLNQAWEKFPPLPPAIITELEKQRGWTKDWIEFFDLRFETWRLSKKGELYKVKQPVKIAIPIRDVSGTLINIRLYDRNSKKFKLMPFAKTIGQSRLFPAKPFSDDKTVLLCEGETDTIKAIMHGFNGITQTSKMKIWPKDHLAMFKGRDVVIAYDADEAGQKWSRFAADALTGHAKSIRMIQWPAFMGSDASGAIPRAHGQDLTDYFIRHKKTSEDLQSLINNAIHWESNPSTPIDQPSKNEKPADSVVDMNDVRQFFDHGINNRFTFKPRLLAERIMADIRLMTDPSTGLVYRWNEKYWQEYEESHLKKIAVELLRNEAQKSRVEDAIFQLKMLTTMPAGRMVNDRIEWINLKSGILNINTFEMIPHDPDFLFTQMLPIDFDPESEKICNTYLKYLETNIKTPEVIAQLQEFTGYCLVRNTKYEKALYLIGPGADGKSTYMKILRELVGPENCSAVSFSAIEDQFQRSAMYNRLVNLSAEISSESLESQYFKKIVSGDTLAAAYKHVDSFEFDPFCKLVFAGNMLPRVRDNTDGYFRKLLIIQMKRQFLEDDKDRDPNLLDKLKTEISEIFYWALCGLKRLVEQGHFTFSDETIEVMQDYRRLNNPVLCYAEEECDIGDGLQITKVDLYSDYTSYCKRNGYTGLNSGNIFRELKSVFRNLHDYRPRKDNPDRLPYIRGIKIKVFTND
jgi:putative DNA primase/helicase